MADLSHISTDGTLPDGAYVANGTGDSNVKSLQSMTETSVRQSLRAGVDDSFGFAKDGLFGVLLRSIGGILSGAVELGAGALSWVVDGVVGLIDGVARAIGNLFGGSNGGQVDPPQPPPPIFNPIKTNLEGVLRPKFEEVDRLLADSAGLGDESKTINQQMRELIDPENPDSRLFDLQTDINELNDDRNDLQDQVDALNTQMLESVQEYVSRTLVARKDRIVEDEYLHVQPSGSRLLVTAKDDSPLGAWTGEVLMQSAYPTGGATYAPVTEFTTIPTGVADSQRYMNWAGGEHNLPVFQYWVRQAVHETDNKRVGHYTTPYDDWYTHPELSFTAPIDTDYSIYYRIVWDGTTYTDDYSFRVLKNGAELFKWGPKTHVGPLAPWESGRRTRTINELNVPLKAGDVLTFQTWSNAGKSEQRSVVSSDRRISWLMSFGSSWVLKSDGEGGFLPQENLAGFVDFVHWQNSARFLVTDVVAGTDLLVWDGYNYVPTPAGTVIPKNAWIRTAEPHPSSVTFRRRS